MVNAYDITFGLLLGATAPVWLAVPKTRRKVLRALRERMGPAAGVARDGPGPAVMIHAVSLGEINATRALVAGLAAARPDLRFVVTATTDTGFARGQELYGPDPKVTLVRYPLDFTPPIERLLAGLRPDVVVLMELEVWPNFVYQCHRRGVPVLLVNGRLTAPSFARYRYAGPVTRRMFGRLGAVRAQDATYADRFVALGTPADRVRVTGTMKFDNAPIADGIAGADDLARDVGLRPGDERIWVCGSTGPGEEEIVLRAYAALRRDDPALRLVIVPRHPERFDGVADLIRREGFPLVRRSAPAGGPPAPSLAAPADAPAAPPVVLGDTMGELRKFYSLAAVVFVGRSLVDLGPRQHGSDMIEPAALGKPVVVGPWTQNFAEPMDRFRAADAVRVAADEAGLRDAVRSCLADPAGTEMGRRARDVVRRERGATDRHVELILSTLPPPRTAPAGTGPA